MNNEVKKIIDEAIREWLNEEVPRAKCTMDLFGNHFQGISVSSLKQTYTADRSINNVVKAFLNGDTTAYDITLRWCQERITNVAKNQGGIVALLIDPLLQQKTGNAPFLRLQRNVERLMADDGVEMASPELIAKNLAKGQPSAIKVIILTDSITNNEKNLLALIQQIGKRGGAVVEILTLMDSIIYPQFN